MKTIIAGSRDIEDYDLVCDAIEDSGFEITEVVSGGARGVDRLGERWADEMGINLCIFPAQWKKLGKSAGPIRNQEMARYADAAIVLIKNHSAGATHMLKTARALGLKVYSKEIT